MDETTLSLAISALIILVLAIVCLIIFLTSRDGVVFLLIFIVLTVISIYIFHLAYTYDGLLKKIDVTVTEINDKLKKAEEERKNALKKAEKEGYKVYIDGREVDPATIDFSMYEVKVNTEKKAVYCTKE